MALSSGPDGYRAWRTDLQDELIWRDLMKHVGKPPPSKEEAEKLIGGAGSTSETARTRADAEKMREEHAAWTRTYLRAATATYYLVKGRMALDGVFC